MKKILKSLTSIENFIMVVTFSIMVICSFAQVINRNFFKLPIPWLEEASIYCMIYMALIGTEVGLRDGTQIAVTAVLDKLHGAFKGIVIIFSKVVVLIFSSSVLISAIHLVSKQVQTGQTSSALHLPMSIPYAALVISFAMIVLVQIAFTVELVITLIREKGKESEA